MEPAFNYPNHPLFRITPLLDLGFQTVRFDPFERVLIGKIRSGQYTADLWNCNGAYLDYADRVGAPAYQQRTAFTSRYEITPEQRQAAMEELERRRNDPVLKAQREAAKAAREAAKAEREQIRRKWAEEQEREQEAYAAAAAAREAARAEQDAEWEQAAAERKRQADAQWEQLGASLTDVKRWQETQQILKNKWQCIRCKGLTIAVEPKGKGYSLECRGCGSKAWGAHGTLLRMTALAA